MIEKAESLNNQAIMFAADGAFPEAIACFKRAIVIQKDNYLLWYNLGVTYRDAGELKKAQSALATAYSMAPENEDVIETYGTISLSLKDVRLVREICSSALDVNDSNPHFYNLAGVTYFQEEDYGTAAEFFEHAVYLNPYYLDALYNLKDTYFMLQNKAGADECEKRIKEIGRK